MADMMEFPNTVEEFMQQYKIIDTEQVYTNGAELVPIFRMKQWFEHIEALPAQAERPLEIQDILDYLDTTLHPIISPEYWNVYSELYDMISMLPSTQTEIIRCKDCKYARLTHDGSCKYCDIWFPDEAEYMDKDYYCASAERKSNG